MTVVLIGVAVLAVFYWFVRREEGSRSRYRAGPGGGDIDREELEQAEREVRDLDIDHHPDDGFEGVVWGPGAPK